MMNEKSVSMIERLCTLFASSDIDHSSWKNIGTYAPNESFMAGNSLFNCMVIVDLTEFRDSDTDYGIVPLPKYDERQDNFISLGNINVVAALCLPKSSSSDMYDNYGRIIESMAALGHYKSLPEAYEATLMTKMTRDDDSVEMLRIVNEGLALDFGYVSVDCIHFIQFLSSLYISSA